MKIQNSNTRNRNFFHKTFILLAILAFTSFGFKVKAQQAFLEVNNNLGAPLGCNWKVVLFDNSSNRLDSLTVNAGGHPAGCRSWLGGAVDHIWVTDGTCTVIFGSGGIFNYTSYAPPCSGSCSISIDCSGGTPSICGSTYPTILVQIY